MPKITHNPYYIDLEELSHDEAMFSVFIEKISKSDDRLRNILLSAETPYFLEALCLTHGLSEKQSGNLSRIVRDLVLGNIKPADTVKEISSRLEVDLSTSQQIESAIDRGLFSNAHKKQPQPPAPPSMKNAPPVNQSNVIDLRNQS